MILRFQTSDNADAWYVSKFCEGLRDRMFAMTETVPERKDYASYDKWMNAVQQFWKADKELKYKRHGLMDPKRRMRTTEKHYKEVVAEVLKQWREYSVPRNLACIHPDVSIKYCLEEGDENGEVVYYFTTSDQIIIQ